MNAFLCIVFSQIRESRNQDNGLIRHFSFNIKYAEIKKVPFKTEAGLLM